MLNIKFLAAGVATVTLAVFAPLVSALEPANSTPDSAGSAIAALSSAPMATEPSASSGHPFWTSAAGALSESANQLIDTITTIEREGLHPDMYRADLLYQLQQHYAVAQPTEIETLFDQLFVSLIDDLGNGIVDPLVAQKQWHREAPGIDTQAFLDAVRSGALSLEQALTQVRPDNQAYMALVQRIDDWMENPPIWDTFPQDIKLQTGDDNLHVADLKVRLKNTGDLPAHASKDSLFDSDLEQAVIRFQQRHGLKADGVVAHRTIAALNVSPEQRLREMKLELERLRWMPREGDNAHILVNIPEFKLHMFNGGEEILNMRVVTGKPKHATPVFSRPMRKVVVAPTWTVPYSIAVNEILPLELSKPGYLDKEKINFFRWNGNGLTPVAKSRITRDDLEERPFQYVLQQQSGEDNVLGRVKFLMPNPYNIYLHDTQAKKLFAKDRRAYSHGCIRLGDPQLLGLVVLQMDGYSVEESLEILANEETLDIDLDTPINTHITYHTTWVDSDGILNFREDIYKRNGQVMATIDQAIKQRKRAAQRFTLPTIIASVE